MYTLFLRYTSDSNKLALRLSIGPPAGAMAEYEVIARSWPRTPGIAKMSERTKRPARSTSYIAPLFGG